MQILKYSNNFLGKNDLCYHFVGVCRRLNLHCDDFVDSRRQISRLTNNFLNLADARSRNYGYCSIHILGESSLDIKLADGYSTIIHAKHTVGVLCGFVYDIVGYVFSNHLACCVMSC